MELHREGSAPAERKSPSEGASEEVQEVAVGWKRRGKEQGREEREEERVGRI